jgi:hypothetical protein
VLTHLPCLPALSACPFSLEDENITGENFSEVHASLGNIGKHPLTIFDSPDFFENLSFTPKNFEASFAENRHQELTPYLAIFWFREQTCPRFIEATCQVLGNDIIIVYQKNRASSDGSRVIPNLVDSPT